jgi:monoterpene epsilon-lactone hydrolase
MRAQRIPPEEWRSVIDASLQFGTAATRAAIRRCLRGPLLPGWSWTLECAVAGIASNIATNDHTSLAEIRVAIDRSGAVPLPSRVKVGRVQAGTVPAEWIRLDEDAPDTLRSDAVLLYLHGGGYIFGSPASHRSLVAELAQATGLPGLLPDYRLAPEHPYPAALEDAWAAYWWLLDQGVDPGRIVVAGESAGGGLTMGLLLALRDAGLPLPACAVCISPWVDMTLSGPSLRTNEPTDYLKLAGLRAAVPLVLNGVDPRTPTISPIFADLHGLPPLLIQAGTAEMLYDDARRLARRAVAHGVEVEFEPWENMVHAWHIMFAFEPAARNAIRRIAQFVHGHVNERGQASEAGGNGTNSTAAIADKNGVGARHE